jgi:hypothetical protein
MENDLYAVPSRALGALVVLMLVIGYLSGMLIAIARRCHAKRQGQRAELKWQDYRNRLPSVTLVKRVAHWRDGVTAFMPQIKCAVLNSDKKTVGHITYVMSPIAECIYLYQIDIREDFLRRGYGTATLLELSESNGGLWITPVQEISTQEALHFWQKIHGLACFGFPVNEQISVGDWDSESRKWSHLQFQESLFSYFKKFHRDDFLEFQIGRFPMATGTEGIQDPEFLESFQPNR